MSETISFNEIPYDWRVPGTYIEVRPSTSGAGLASYPRRVLLLGVQHGDTPAVSLRPFRITRETDALALTGRGRAISGMISRFLQANTTTELWGMLCPPPAGSVQATATLTVTGTATNAGTIAFYAGGRRLAVPVADAATAATAAAALAAAVNADADCLVSAAVTPPGILTLTCKELGTPGNQVDFSFNLLAGDAFPPGLGFALALGTAGAGDPDMIQALAAIAGDWFTDLVLPWTDEATLAPLRDELTRRYQAMGKLDMRAHLGLADTFGNLSAKGAAQGTAGKLLDFWGADGSPSPPWEWAASAAGVMSFQLTNDPARQLRGLALPGIVAPQPALRFTPEERDGLLRSGISTWSALADNSVVIERAITACITNELGVLDASWLDVMTPETLSRIRYDWMAYVGLTYPRSKLADDGSAAAQYGGAVATPGRLKASWAARCKLYEQIGWIEGASGPGGTSAQSVFQRDASDRNRVNARQPIVVIGNLMVLAGALEFEA